MMSRAAALVLLASYLCFSLAQQSFFNSSCSCDDPFSAVTYNTLQITFSNNREERLRATVDIFANPPFDLDLVCFQETWDPARRDILAQGVAGQFPYSYFAPQVPQECTNACRVPNPLQLERCIATTNCFAEDNGVRNLFECVDNQNDFCDDVLDQIDDECKICLGLAAIDLPDFGQCDDTNDLVQGRCIYLFQGFLDPLLVSRYPFIETGSIAYTNTPLIVWGAIYGKIALSPSQNLTVFCTHLSAPLPIIGDLADIEEANRDQAVELVNWVNQVAGPNDKVLVMGDMNNGPEVGSNEGLFTAGYQQFTNAGWDDLVLRIPGTPCTYCSDNPLVTQDSSEIRDHIFATGNFSGVCLRNASIILTERIVDIGDELVPPSDHYGIYVSFCGFNQSAAPNNTNTTTPPPTSPPPTVSFPGIWTGIVTPTATGSTLGNQATATSFDFAEDGRMTANGLGDIVGIPGSNLPGSWNVNSNVTPNQLTMAFGSQSQKRQQQQSLLCLVDTENGYDARLLCGQQTFPGSFDAAACQDCFIFSINSQQKQLNATGCSEASTSKVFTLTSNGEAFPPFFSKAILTGIDPQYSRSEYQYGKLTGTGLGNAFDLGVLYRARYQSSALFSSTDPSSQYFSGSTNYTKTIQQCLAFSQGIFPPSDQAMMREDSTEFSVPLLIVPGNNDTQQQQQQQQQQDNVGLFIVPVDSSLVFLSPAQSCPAFVNNTNNITTGNNVNNTAALDDLVDQLQWTNKQFTGISVPINSTVPLREALSLFGIDVNTSRGQLQALSFLIPAIQTDLLLGNPILGQQGNNVSMQDIEQLIILQNQLLFALNSDPEVTSLVAAPMAELLVRFFSENSSSTSLPVLNNETLALDTEYVDTGVEQVSFMSLCTDPFSQYSFASFLGFINESNSNTLLQNAVIHFELIECNAGSSGNNTQDLLIWSEFQGLPQQVRWCSANPCPYSEFIDGLQQQVQFIDYEQQCNE